MQQIKKELQQTISKLKGEWGINNFSLQDLASILEKVVAAVDKAAQLPAVPAKPEYVGGVIYAMTLRGLSNEINVRYEKAPSGSVPAIYNRDGGDGPRLVMYRPSDNTAYSLTEQGEDVYSAYMHSIILCEHGIVSYEHDFLGRSGPLTKVETTPYNQG